MKADTNKPLNWYKYETAKITILWKGKKQTSWLFKTAEEALEIIYSITFTDAERKDFSINTPDGLINYEQFKTK